MRCLVLLARSCTGSCRAASSAKRATAPARPSRAVVYRLAALFRCLDAFAGGFIIVQSSLALWPPVPAI